MNPPKLRNRGVTLVELLITIVAVASFSTVAFSAFSGISGATSRQKLSSDVRTLNRAVQIYRTFHGSLDSARSPEQVIARLKTSADSLSAKQTAGLTGGMIDRRLVPVLMTPSESATSMPRAVWNPSELRFEIVTSGSGGVKLFDLNEEAAALPDELEARTPSLKLASRDHWIWDYADSPAGASVEPSDVDTSLPLPNPGPDASPELLNPPTFSIPGGNYPITEFNLPLILVNPNRAGSSRILYSVGFGPWQNYDLGIIPVEPGAAVRAYVETIHPAYRDSVRAMHIYLPLAVQLETPEIVVGAPKFDYDANQSIEVTLTNPNEDIVSDLVYRINDEAWQAYSGPFNLSVFMYYLEGAAIEAKAVPAAEHYEESESALARVEKPDPWFNISGAADGVFGSPQGPSSMFTNLESGETGHYFTWGTATGTNDPSWLRYTGNSFVDVNPGERFQVGTLEYYNGTIRSNSGSNAVDLDIQLQFDGTITRTFTFNLELINSPNNSGSPEADADFVRFGSQTSELSTTIRGHQYNLILEFGESTEHGFSNRSEFHVFEDERAQSSVYARLEFVE